MLAEILRSKQLEVERLKRAYPLEKLLADSAERSSCRNFAEAISRGERVHLVAEIKPASPSAGILRGDVDVASLARLYETCGGAAVSILTEDKYFGGHLDNLEKARQACSLPILMKDFIIDRYQIYQGRAAGADAILLIASLLPTRQLEAFLSLAQALGMKALVEVHGEEDLAKALKVDASIIGINNRDLRTFEVDLNTTFRLRDKIPAGKLVVSASGIKTREDVAWLASIGVNALLIGEALMSSQNVAGKIRELFGGLLP